MSSRRTLQDTNLPAASRSTKTNSINSRSSKTSTASTEFDPEREKKVIEALRKERTAKKFDSRAEYLKYLSDFDENINQRNRQENAERETNLMILQGRAIPYEKRLTTSSSGSSHNKSNSSISSGDINPTRRIENSGMARYRQRLKNKVAKYGTTDPNLQNRIKMFTDRPYELKRGEQISSTHPIMKHFLYKAYGGVNYLATPETQDDKIPQLFKTRKELEENKKKIKGEKIMRTTGKERLKQYLPNLSYQDPSKRSRSQRLPPATTTSQYHDEPQDNDTIYYDDDYTLIPRSSKENANLPMQSDSFGPTRKVREKRVRQEFENRNTTYISNKKPRTVSSQSTKKTKVQKPTKSM